LWQIESAVEKRGALRGRIAQEYRDLAVLNPSCGPAILALDANRMRSFFQKARLVDNQNGILTTQVFNHIRPKIVANLAASQSALVNKR